MPTPTTIWKYSLYSDNKPVTYELQGETFLVEGPSIERLIDQIVQYFDIISFDELDTTIDIDGTFSYNGIDYQIMRIETKVTEVLGFEVRRAIDYING